MHSAAQLDLSHDVITRSGEMLKTLSKEHTRPGLEEEPGHSIALPWLLHADSSYQVAFEVYGKVQGTLHLSPHQYG